MKISQLEKAPDWLLKAYTKNADITWCSCGCGLLIWKSGEFLGGDFLGGNFRGGEFRGGNFRGGDFLGGNFLGGDFRGGDFLGGNFLGGNVCGFPASRILTLTHCEGWPKTLIARDGVAWILAGCLFFTLADARKHWADRSDRPITRTMLISIGEVAKQWGLKDQ